MNLGVPAPGEYRIALAMGATPNKQTTIATADGLQLHAELWRPDQRAPIAVAVMIHGFSAHCGNYRHVAQQLAAGGVATWLFDSRGHGLSQGRRGFVRRFSDYSDDLDLMVTAARAEVPGVPVA